jgi:hypothetical protein
VAGFTLARAMNFKGTGQRRRIEVPVLGMTVSFSLTLLAVWKARM